MDILAWIIAVSFVSFVLLPAIVDFFSYSYMDYKECWIAGNGTVVIFAALFGVFGAVFWAFDRIMS